MKDLSRCSWMMLPLALLGSTSCSSSSGGGVGAAAVITGSGTVVDEDRAVSGFTRLVFFSEGAVTIEQGAAESLRIRADDNLLQYLTSSVQGGTLQLRTGPNVDLRPTQTIEWHLTVTSLEDVDLGGIGGVEVLDLTTNRLSMNCDGIGAVVLDNLTATQLDVDLGGFRSLRASGTVDLQTATLSAFGFEGYDAEQLQSREAHVNVHGHSDATVRVSDLLVVTITSSGSVYYIGSPTVDATITGTGQVIQLSPSIPAGPMWVFGDHRTMPIVVWVPPRGARSD